MKFNFLIPTDPYHAYYQLRVGVSPHHCRTGSFGTLLGDARRGVLVGGKHRVCLKMGCRWACTQMLNTTFVLSSFVLSLLKKQSVMRACGSGVAFQGSLCMPWQACNLVRLVLYCGHGMHTR